MFHFNARAYAVLLAASLFLPGVAAAQCRPGGPGPHGGRTPGMMPPQSLAGLQGQQQGVAALAAIVRQQQAQIQQLNLALAAAQQQRNKAQANNAPFPQQARLNQRQQDQQFNDGLKKIFPALNK